MLWCDTLGIGSTEPFRCTATVLVSEPPHAFVAFRVYLNCSSTGPVPLCVGLRVMDFVPLASTEPPGSSEAASELDDDQVRVVVPCSMILSPIRRYLISSGEALSDDCTAALTSTVVLGVVTPPGPEAES